MKENVVSTLENNILKESVESVKKILGNEYENMTVDRAVLGLFFSGVKLSSGHGGICFTPVKEIPEAVCCPSSAAAMPLSGKLSGRNVKDYIDDIFKENVLRRALGIATLNALSTLCWEKMNDKNYEISTNVDAFDEIEITKEEKVVVVGALVPMIKKLIKNGNEFCILEMDPATLKEHEMKYFVDACNSDKVVPSADVLVITGVSVINNTLEGLLSLAKKDARIVVTGPTVSMLPDAFFKRGVTVIGGIIVTKSDEVLDVISEGGSGYHFFGKSAERTVIKLKGEINEKNKL